MKDGQKKEMKAQRQERLGHTPAAPMDKEQFRAEKLYQMSACLAESMLEEGIISQEEYQQADRALLEKYKPVLGTLLAGKPLQ